MTNTPYPTPPRPAGWFGGFDSRDVVTSPIRNITVGPNDGTFIPGHGYANGRTVSYMVATAIIVAMGWTR